MKNKKNLLVLLLIIVISIGFSAISASLSITGNSSISRNTWDVHFENVQVTTGSITAPTPVISNNDTTVTYNVTLTMPGDYYEFTVDAVNDGTIDAMIESFSNTGLTEAQQNYLTYSITYSDGVGLANKQLLSHGSTETYKVRVDYKKDISSTDLPGTDQTIALTFSVNYVQANAESKVIRMYAVPNGFAYIGSKIPDEVKLRLTPLDAMTDWQDIIETQGETRPIYLKYIISDDKLSEAYLEFVITEEMASANPGMTAGTYSLKGGVDESALTYQPIYESNKAELLKAFGPTYCEETYNMHCQISNLLTVVDTNGPAAITPGDMGCYVDNEETYCGEGV